MIIGICDDDVLLRDGLKKLCEHHVSTMPSIEVVCFSSGEQVLAYSSQIDILFLDIYMKGVDGMYVARKIREEDENMIIIFITGSLDYVREGYIVNAFRYIIKPIKKKEIIDSLKDAIRELTKNDKVQLECIDGKILFVKINDILYIEYIDRKTIVRTKYATYETRLSLKEWEDILSNGAFYRTHKAYIVNLSHIEEIGTDIIMENGEKVEISVRQMSNIKKICSEYGGRKIY